ncbi:MAG TPA: hypothetical protein VG847_10550 [Chitinophagaceae bacterium]|nr:hypothetical protein [Chitinophagaceae bacterium]
MKEEVIVIINSLTTARTDQAREKLIPLINDLINRDFNSLVQLLYRIDVDEGKLKAILKEHPEQNAASLIADQIISRQLQKIVTRKEFDQQKNKNDKAGW